MHILNEVRNAKKLAELYIENKSTISKETAEAIRDFAAVLDNQFIISPAPNLNARKDK